VVEPKGFGVIVVFVIFFNAGTVPDTYWGFESPSSITLPLQRNGVDVQVSETVESGMVPSVSTVPVVCVVSKLKLSTIMPPVSAAAASASAKVS
jgi:hypothetical protein